jgi:hypothetical protein
LVLGVGLGALVPEWFASSALVILLVGVALHAFGMWDKHRIEASTQEKAVRWVAVAYWMCWLLLAGLALFLAAGG